MCAPAALAATSFALNAGGTLLGGSAQNKAARDNKRAALSAQTADLNTLTLRGLQEEQAATSAGQRASRQVAQDQSINSVAAAANGVAGNSVAALQAELDTQLGQYKDSVAENLRNTLAQLNREKAGVVARTQARIQSVRPANPYAVGLQIASAGLDSFTQLQSQKPVHD